MKPHTLLATWFGCGYMRPGPGTWGTLGGMPLALILLATGGASYLLAGLAVIVPLGLWAAHRLEKETGEHDSSKIVVDEVAGLCVAMLAAVPEPVSVVLAFLLFRVFDILKPWPVSWADKELPGAWGVMADDLIAGVYAAACLTGLRAYAGIG